MAWIGRISPLVEEYDGMTEEKKKSAIEETIDEMFVDPDSSANHPSKKPPQTTDAEPRERKS